jgi:hypothetical protein
MHRRFVRNSNVRLGDTSRKRNLRTLRAPLAASRQQVEKFTQEDECVRQCVAGSSEPSKKWQDRRW